MTIIIKARKIQFTKAPFIISNDFVETIFIL